MTTGKFAALAVGLIIPAAVLAGTDDIVASNNQVAVQFISTYVDYTEKGNGFLGTSTEVLDMETGSVSGIAFSVSVLNREDDAYFQAGFDRSTGYTHYTGAFIGGQFGTVRGLSSATLSNYEARLGRGFSLDGPYLLTPYLEMGGHEWNRGVNYGEIYVHSYLGAGLLAQYSPQARLVLSASALAGRTFGSYITVNSGPGLNGFSGALGNSPLYRIGIAMDYAFTAQIHGGFAFDYTAFRYGMSAAYPVGGSVVEWEPASTTRYTTLRLGLGAAF